MKVLATIGLVIVTTLILGPVLTSGGEDEERSTVRTEPVFRTAIPIDALQAVSISKAFVTERATDNRGVEIALSRLERLLPGWVDRIVQEPVVGRWLQAFTPDGQRLSPTDEREFAFLLAWSFASNIPADQRSDAIRHLRRRTGEASRPLIRQVAMTTTDVEEFFHTATKSIGYKARPEDAEWLVRLWEVAGDRGFTRPMPFILETLAYLEHENVVAMCKDVLEGRFGSFTEHRLPPAAFVLLRLGHAKKQPHLRAIVEKFATEGQFPLGRAMAIQRLWETTQEQQWKTALHDLLEDPDPDARWLAFQEVTKLFEVTRGFLERFKQDPDPRIRERATFILAMMSR